MSTRHCQCTACGNLETGYISNASKCLYPRIFCSIMSLSSKILEGAMAIAKATQIVCDSVPILGVFKPIAVIVVKICETAQTVKRNKESIAQLCDSTASVMKAIVDGIKNRPPGAPPAEHDLLNLKQTLDDICLYISKCQRQSRGARAWLPGRAATVKIGIDDLELRLTKAMNLFVLESSVVARQALTEIRTLVLKYDAPTSTAMARKIHRHHINMEPRVIQGYSDSGSGRVIAYRLWVSSFVEPSGNSVSLLTREYSTEEAYEEAVARYNIWSPFLLQIYGISDGHIVHFRGHPDSMPLTRYLENVSWRSGHIITEEKWGEAIMAILDYLGVSVDWEGMFLDPSRGINLDWFIVQGPSKLVLVDWITLKAGKTQVPPHMIISEVAKFILKNLPDVSNDWRCPEEYISETADVIVMALTRTGA